MVSGRAIALWLLGQLLVAGQLSAQPFQRFQLCLDYHCDTQQTSFFNWQEWRIVEKLFQPAPANATAERKRIQKAVAKMEQLAGKRSEIWRDLPKNQGEGSEIGQLDCISESTNTTTFLGLLQQAGLLRFHRVEARRVRNPRSLSVHWSAVIKQISNQEEYAVDSWVFENGTPPLIQPLADWLNSAAFE